MKLDDYIDFLAQADSHFSTIRSNNKRSFQCGLGCTGCCGPDLSVLKIEATNIIQYLLARPKLVETIKRLHEADPHNGSRCAFLTKMGECTIYPVRPFICRSHGAPIAIDQDDYYQIDVCPLNFTDNPIEELGQENFFLLDDWNDRLLSFYEDEDRVPLRLDSLLSL